MNNDKALELLSELEPLLRKKDTGYIEYMDDLFTVKGAGEMIEHLEGYRFKQALVSLENLKKRLESGNA